MGGLDFLKKKEKKTEDSLPPPPPPIPPALGEIGDIEPIKPSFEKPDFSIPEIEMEPKPKTGAPVIREFEEKIVVEKREPIMFQEPEIEESPEFKDKGPFFVSLSDYEKIEHDVKSIENLIEDAEDNLRILSEAISAEENLFKKWRSFLEGVEKKLTFVDKIIAKAGE